MRIKTSYFILLSLFISSILAVSFSISFQSHTAILSPLPEMTYAKTVENTPTPTPSPTSTPTPTPLPPTPTITPTSTPSPTPILIAPQDLEELFSKYANEYSVDNELLKRIAKCESNFNPGASTSLYAGLYQFSEGLWISTRMLMGQNSDVNLRFDAQEAIRTAAFMVSQNHLGIWPNCSR